MVTEDEKASDNLRGWSLGTEMNLSVTEMIGEVTRSTTLQLSKISIKLPDIPGPRVAQLSEAPKECVEEENIDISYQKLSESQLESEQTPVTTCQDMSVARLSETQGNRDMSWALSELSKPLEDCKRTIVELSLAIQSNDWYRRNHPNSDTRFPNYKFTTPPYPLCLPPEYKIEENLQIPEPVPPQEVGFEEYTEIFVQMEEIVTELVTKSLEEINLQSTLIE